MAKAPRAGASDATGTKLAAAIKKAAGAKKIAAAAARTAASAKKAADAAAAKAATAAAKAAAAEAKVAAMPAGGTRSAATPNVATLVVPGWLANLYTNTGDLLATAEIIDSRRARLNLQQMNLLLDLRELDVNQVWFLAALIVCSAEGEEFNPSSRTQLLLKLANEVTTLNEGPQHL